jgi:thiamine-phosphate pyrophosphorylase
LSTHTSYQFERGLRLDIDYIALGPIFPTASKVSEYPPLGCSKLAELAEGSSIPVVAIGGITLENAPDVWRAGASAVAVISDLASHTDPAGRVRQYLALYDDLKRKAAR